MVFGPSRLVRLLALTAAVVAGLPATANGATASAAPAPRDWPFETFTRTVEPWSQASPPAATAVPAVDLTAACVRVVPGGLEAVFGYDNPESGSILVPLAADGGPAGNNAIVREVFSARQRRWTTHVEELGPQATLFKPGADPYAFAVRFAQNERVAWQVHVPSNEPMEDGGFKVTVRPELTAPCGPLVPKHFAVVQHAIPSVEPTNFEYGTYVDPEIEVQFITAYDAEMTLAHTRAACSAGGSLFNVKLVAGWPVGANLEPLDPAVDVILDDVFIPAGGGHSEFVFEMTTTTVRAVAAVAEKVIVPGPIADVSVRCRFGNQFVESDVFWAESPGFVGFEPFCIFDPECINDTFVLGVDISITAPAGSRLR